MSQITAADVQKLRARTGMQMMKCKAALTEASGDMEKAVEILRRQNKDAVDKVVDREAGEGRIGVYIDPVAKVGAIIELRCESAPVAKSDLFIALAGDLARQIAHNSPASSEALLAQPFVDTPGRTVADRIADVVGLMREKMTPARFTRLHGGLMGSYIHHDGSNGVLLQVEGAKDDPTLLRDVCMHIVARSPMAAVREEIPADRVEKEKAIALGQATEQGKGKPAQIIEKIAEGKLRTWFGEHVLSEQPFVKDESKTIGDLLKGAGLKLVGFVRYKVGG
jgi:elongation factor Ts